MNIGENQIITPAASKYLRCLLLFLLFSPSFFYFSLAFECYLQRKHADNFEKQYIDLSGRDSNKYIFAKDIYFTPEVATFQSSGGRIYVYVRNSAFNNKTIQNIHLEVIRENHEEIKRYQYNYSDSEKGVERFQRPGFHCLAFPSVKLHIDYNNIKFVISGIDLPSPDNDAEIMLVFSGIKRRVILWTYLFKGLSSLAGCLLIIAIYALIQKIVRKSR